MYFLLYLLCIKTSSKKCNEGDIMTDEITNKKATEIPEKSRNELKEKYNRELNSIGILPQIVNQHFKRAFNNLRPFKKSLSEYYIRQIDKNFGLMSQLNDKFNQAVKLFFAICKENHMRCKDGQCLICLGVIEEFENKYAEVEAFKALDFTKDNVPLVQFYGRHKSYRTIRLEPSDEGTSNALTYSDIKLLHEEGKIKCKRTYELSDFWDYEHLERELERLEFNLQNLRAEAYISIDELDIISSSGLCFYDEENTLIDFFIFESVELSIKDSLITPITIEVIDFEYLDEEDS